MARWIRVLAASLLLALPGVSAHADDAPATQASATQTPQPVKTGKERLSDKASDEQRVDNCKVPPERRGTKMRPSDCPSEPKIVPTN
jgi:hypothetical protein